MNPTSEQIKAIDIERLELDKHKNDLLQQKYALLKQRSITNSSVQLCASKRVSIFKTLFAAREMFSR